MEWFNKLSPEWKSLFPEMKDIPETTYNPFRCFTFFQPKECVCVIVGQDPYAEGADGLAFSSEKIQMSNRKIFNSMLRHQIISTMPATGKLDPWASRGVLLINSSLTPDSVYWHPIVSLVLRRLAAIKKLPAFVWGSVAAKLIDWSIYNAYFCTHPASNGTWDFDAFKLIDINWELIPKYVVFTDGACSFNGKPFSKAGWGVAVYRDGVLIHQECDSLKSKNYLTSETVGTDTIFVTNNRAELMAAIRGLEYISKIQDTAVFELVTDSTYVHGILTGWLEKWEKTGKEAKNPDLLKLIKSVYRCQKISYTHCMAHTGKKDFYSIGNELVDKLAVSCKR